MHRPSHLASLGLLTLALLLSFSFLGGTALAAEEAAAVETAEPTAQASAEGAPAAPVGTCPSPAPSDAAAPIWQAGLGDPIAPNYCQADCGTYTDVSVSCSGTCVAVDRNCAVGERGYVIDCNHNYTYCPPCGCNAVANCTQGPDVACSGSSNCVAVDQNCNYGQQGYVQCDSGPKLYCTACPYCPYEECPEGISCNNDDDCCSSLPYGEGYCVNGECQCDF